MEAEIYGQCIGGPDHGNIVSATVEEFGYAQTTVMYLDGPGEEPSTVTIFGSYRWNGQHFEWIRGGSKSGE